MFFSLQVSVTIAPISVSFPVFSEAVYQPTPLSEKILPDSFVVEISVLYNVPVIYSIVSGNEKGKLFKWTNKEHGMLKNYCCRQFSFWIASCLFSFALISVLQPWILGMYQPDLQIWYVSSAGTWLNFCQTS